MVKKIFDEVEESMGFMIIEHGPETLEVVKELSDFVANLPLSHADNDKLIHLMTDQLEVAEREQFLRGFDLGVRLTKDFEKERKRNDQD